MRPVASHPPVGRSPARARAFLPGLAAVWLIVLLAACGTPKTAAPPAPPAAPAPPPVPPPEPPAPTPVPRANLALEQVRLADLFRGTPVVFAMQQDGSLRATVPRRFSFDAGTAKVKPPLAAVLDRLAKSQAQTGARMRVSAPADPPARAAALARNRAAAVREHLNAQGIVASRIETSSAVQTEQVEIVVIDATR